MRRGCLGIRGVKTEERCLGEAVESLGMGGLGAEGGVCGGGCRKSEDGSSESCDEVCEVFFVMCKTVKLVPSKLLFFKTLSILIFKSTISLNT